MAARTQKTQSNATFRFYDRNPAVGEVRWTCAFDTTDADVDAAMYALGRFDEDYASASDDSRILCQGSDFVGPMRSESDAYSYATTPEWFARLIGDAARFVTSEIGTVLGVPATTTFSGPRG